MHVSAAAIHATGGAAANRAILQVLADVFDAPVLHFPATDAAALGAALRALQADTGVAWDRATDGFTTPSDSAVLPIPANVDALARLRQVHGEREAAALRERL
jgi:sugar (pentulose or hexulose) kinase